MPRFYCASHLPEQGEFILPPDAAHHAARVLRLRVGDTVEIFDGIGQLRHAQIAEINGKQVVLQNLQRLSENCESPLSILLAQALSSNDKMDWVIQKATELGVSAIQPVATERSVVKLSAERSEKRLEHWRKIVISACEQCGRNVLPEMLPALSLSDWLATQQDDGRRKLILLPDGAQSLTQQNKPEQGVTLLIGPEGGFAAHESAAARAVGFIPIRLGPRVLRTETAAVAGLTALQTVWGDFL